jgi:hypothetical protein
MPDDLNGEEESRRPLFGRRPSPVAGAGGLAPGAACGQQSEREQPRAPPGLRRRRRGE